MKASELIKELQELIDEYGDKEVGYDGGYGEIGGVEYVDVNSIGDRMDCFTVS